MGKIITHTTNRHLHLHLDGIEDHYGAVNGFTVGFESYGHDEDPTPLFAGLPGNACQARHWGVVFEGTVVFRHTDGGTDVIKAGEAYYVAPGHRPLFEAGTRAWSSSARPTSSPRRWRWSRPPSTPCERAER